MVGRTRRPTLPAGTPPAGACLPLLLPVFLSRLPPQTPAIPIKKPLQGLPRKGFPARGSPN